jgi:hypothetical protein
MNINLLTVFLIIFFGCNSLFAQKISLEHKRGVLLHLTGEDQHGERITFEPPEEKPLILFFLPKADSRSEAELLMDHVTRFFESLNEFSKESISGLLVVEPVRSGPLVNRIFRSRLSDKPFPVIRDTGGEITGRVYDKPYSIMAWLVNGNGDIQFRTTEPFSDSENQRLRENIEGISNKGNTTKTRLNENE